MGLETDRKYHFWSGFGFTKRGTSWSHWILSKSNAFEQEDEEQHFGALSSAGNSDHIEMLAARPAGEDELAGEGRPVRPLHEGGGPVALLQHQVGQPAGREQLR